MTSGAVRNKGTLDVKGMIFKTSMVAGVVMLGLLKFLSGGRQ